MASPVKTKRFSASRIFKYACRTSRSISSVFSIKSTQSFITGCFSALDVDLLCHPDCQKYPDLQLSQRNIIVVFIIRQRTILPVTHCKSDQLTARNHLGNLYILFYNHRFRRFLSNQKNVARPNFIHFPQMIRPSKTS